MSDLRNVVGDRIRAIRKAKELTQQELAERSNLDDAYIGAVERGERNFSIDTLDKIVEGLDISPGELFRTSKRKSNEEAVRQQVIDELVAAIGRLDIDQVDILRKVNKELIRAFK
ncbi:helix-turn-helix transcriptional regulator [Paenibacillus sp. ATY16]|uniref:helix-turn-helix domain-containing protein n=1 Tax=Paenibacillus sp. ATY16 TaxID=1759312 RepID=UPI000E2EE5E2|nr:helix-turn-helix transcriptional regulator [Paenibacillus sp. ATY16]MCK9857597.1 helix-turn-helix domain-containing protein [Paenibacillus sp. ATY16]